MVITEKNIEQLRTLCLEHHVEKLYLFGSAITEGYHPNSDIDFLVKFKSFDLAYYFENYLDFKEKLKILFKRRIDLLEEQTLKNPILVQSINKNKRLIYG